MELRSNHCTLDSVVLRLLLLLIQLILILLVQCGCLASRVDPGVPVWIVELHVNLRVPL